MLTDLGKELRKLRIDREERLVDMGAKLKVSASFLSAIEVGSKPVPKGFEESVIRAYDLPEAAARRVRTSADRSRSSFSVEPRSPLGRDAAALFARKINQLSDDDLEEINSILNKGDRDD